jgi:hypothetical protein
MKQRTIFWIFVVLTSTAAISGMLDTEKTLSVFLLVWKDVLYALFPPFLFGSTASITYTWMQNKRTEPSSPSSLQGKDIDGGLIILFFWIPDTGVVKLAYISYIAMGVAGWVCMKEILYGLLLIQLQKQCKSFGELPSHTRDLIVEHIRSGVFGTPRVKVHINEFMTYAEPLELRDVLEHPGTAYVQVMGIPDAQRALSALLKNIDLYLEHQKDLIDKYQQLRCENNQTKLQVLRENLSYHKENFVKQWGPKLLPPQD